VVGALASGCGGAEAGPSAARGDVDPLSRCAETREGSDFRSWSCGDHLTAIETWVEVASDRDVKLAIDGFAATFPAASPKRVDSIWAVGNARHTWVRLEGTSNRGQPLEAQMVAVEMGEGVRLVTCQAQGPEEACGPVVAKLVDGVD
jgi:hypothetical protein